MKKCLKCGGETFKALIKRAALVQIQDDSTVVILKEGTNNFQLIEEELICANKECAAVASFQELVAKTPCSSCGEPHEEKELVDGKCELCILKDKLGSATKEDLFKLILELQHKAGPVEMKNEKKIEEAEQITEKVEQKNASEPESEEEPTKKKRTSRKSKRKDSEEEEEAVEETSGKEIEGEPVPVDEEKTENPLPAATSSEEKPMTPERAEASDVSTKPQEAPVNTLSDIFGEPENSNPEIGEEETVNPEPPADFVF